MPSFSQSSLIKLTTCDLRLQKLFKEVIEHYDCKILEGHRSAERQAVLYDQGKSQVRFPHSKHNNFPSKAVDVAPYPIVWPDEEKMNPEEYRKEWNRWYEFAGFVLGTALQMGISVKWGGHFKSFIDAPHWQIIGE